MIAALILAALAQVVDVAPNVIHIPKGQGALGTWPGYEASPQVGYASLTVTYVVPAGGVATNGSILLGLGYLHDATSTNPAYAATKGWLFGPTESISKFPFGQFQRAQPSQPNWCSATTSAGAITCALFRHPNYSQDALLRIKAATAQPGGTVWTVVLGDVASSSPGLSLSWQPGCVSVVALEDLANTGTWTAPTYEPPTVLVTGVPEPDGFIVNGPCTPRVGVPARVTIRPVTGHDGPARDPIMPCEDFAGTVFLQCSDPLATFATPIEFDFALADRGCREVFVAFATPGVQTITATWRRDTESLGSQVASMSNSMIVQPATATTTIYCGDLQRHSSPGGHAALPDDHALADLWQDNQDFGAATQHSYNYMADWASANARAAAFTATHYPFVAFPCYEWSLGGSHRHVVYRNVTGDPAITDRTYEGFGVPAPTLKDTVADFCAALLNDPTDRPHFAQAHHSLWDGSKGGFAGPYDWGDDAAQPVVEIFSDHGSSEVWLGQAANPDDYPISGDLALGEQRGPNDGASVRNALALGHRFGFVAGSDRHNYRSYVAGVEGFTRTGLGFVVARRDVDARTGIWHGLTHRRCYATTGARIVLDWRAGDGTKMGMDTATATPSFTLEAHASGILRPDRPTFTLVLFVRDDVVLETRPLAASDVAESFVDATAPAGTHAYYARLTQDDWHVAWTSPIWVTVP